MKARPGPVVRGLQGTPLATWDLGGEGPPLLILHATGFHGRCYAPLAADLLAHFHCWTLDQRGHGRSGPAPSGDYDWRSFGADALAVIDQLGLERPFVFGHSMGGAVALLADANRPGVFAGMHLYEPIVFPPAPERGTRSDNPLSAMARRRRSRFPSRAEALANYAGKPPFSRFRADALLAYVEGGFAEIQATREGGFADIQASREGGFAEIQASRLGGFAEIQASREGGFADVAGGGVELLCGTEVEAQIYEAAPLSGAFDRLKDVGAPVALACGALHPDINPDQLDAIAGQLARAHVEVYAGLSHFGPLEDPSRVAAGVLAALAAQARST